MTEIDSLTLESDAACRFAEENARLRADITSLRREVNALHRKNVQLADELTRVHGELLDVQREETLRLGTFPAPPRSKLGVVTP